MKGGNALGSATLKRTFVYSSDRTKYLLENLLEDASNYEHKTVSAVIETLLLDSLLPENNEAKYFIENLYTNDWTIQDTLIAIFEYLSAGLNWKSRYNNGKDLVTYSMQQSSLNHSIIDTTSADIYHMLNQFDSVIKKMEKSYEAYEENYDAANEIAYAKEIYRQLESKDNGVSMTSVYNIIITNWDDLKDWTITYRLLSDLVKLENTWSNNANRKYELSLLIRNLAKDWN